MIDIYELCGYVAGILFAGSLIPQLYKSYKTRILKDISLGYQGISIVASILVIIYAIHNDLKPVYISSITELSFMIILLVLKLYDIKNPDIKKPDIDNINNP